MLKETVSTVSYPLQLLFNRSLRDCVYPVSLKLANGDRSLPSNYRPISLISCEGKIIVEHIVFKYVYNHLHAKYLIYKLQSWFLPGHSA
ncbi:hypothetical protein MAR_002168, partial [Mya arenaria]